ncbi:phytanoyl-CoA dioxygenase family protein [Paenibacillus sp. GP183]|jgi:ectoine hydroxylase-related dioxygenase (phytanoyl-CoA dioxygenase family)|uniref:phytanoyl-CoA dioxygenase family protein n=1 Tax=Paenibacillus sp. GP183 TaxID=1882751 RepID=UPI00089C0392|nr:phytanoyl-CoA dioxygenase family protein [Paenibacillus sp. GP183]SEC02482.1 Ectoine hydroxylase-related dioxygenase, phytanoyl-CoA dioxygenase (PhyH) family [Paenibacillus sp. GP183]
MEVSRAELDNGKLLPENVELAAKLIEVNGYVVFERVLPKDKIERIHRRYMEILEPYLDEHREEVYNPGNGFNDGTNHIRLFLPFEEPFIDDSIIAHPFVTDVLDRLLGEDFVLHYFATNTSLPGGRNSQPVHADTGSHFGERCAVNLPISNLVVNIPLVNTDETNGPMEIWPGGTHLLPDSWYSAKSFSKAKLAEHMHSVKAVMPAGSIMIRDDRMWHRGTPNRSDQPRPNIAMIYAPASNAPKNGTIQIPTESYDRLSERARKLLRFEKIGYPAIAPFH